MTITAPAPQTTPVETAAAPTPDPNECAPACPGLLLMIGQHASGCIHYVNPHGKAWCPECRTRRQIEEVHDESEMTRAGEVAYSVTRLVCDHYTEQHSGRVIAPAPGAPYAGRLTSPTARTRDLAATAAKAARMNGDLP